MLVNAIKAIANEARKKLRLSLAIKMIVLACIKFGIMQIKKKAV